LVHYKTHQNYYRNQSDPPQKNATLLFFASNLPIKPLEQVKIARLIADGSIVAWGHAGYGGTGAPSGNGYTNIYSTSAAFEAARAGKNCSVNAEDKVPCSST
jgi:predicted SnoaL-like aldol condensation-catalyzing enzyme